MEEKVKSYYFCLNKSKQVLCLDEFINELAPYTSYWVIAEDRGRKHLTRYWNQYTLYDYRMLDEHGEPKNITIGSFEIIEIFDYVNYMYAHTTIYRIQDREGVVVDLELGNRSVSIHSLQILWQIGQVVLHNHKSWREFKGVQKEQIATLKAEFVTDLSTEVGANSFFHFWEDFSGGNNKYYQKKTPPNDITPTNVIKNLRVRFKP
jgi:hypothetical protein